MVNYAKLTALPPGRIFDYMATGRSAGFLSVGFDCTLPMLFSSTDRRYQQTSLPVARY
jgi:hypothetical protein